MDPEANSKYTRWKQSTRTILTAVTNEGCQPYSIPVVPDELRKWNENSYMPKTISIGPLHNKGRRDLMRVEEIKWRCIVYLLARTKDPVTKFNFCMELVLKLDAAVRASYVDEIKLDEYDLAIMMVYDGCFLIELLISESPYFDSELPSREKYPSPAKQVLKIEHIFSDLIMVENQIPLVILNVLFQNLFVDEFFDSEYPSPFEFSPILVNLIQSFFDFGLEVQQHDLNFDKSHFLEIVSSCIGMEEKIEKEKNNKEILNHASIDVGEITMKHLNRCAIRLKAAGITIKDNDGNNIFAGNNLFNFNIKFNDGILEIPQLVINQTAEAKWRNFIAWEHHKEWKKSSSLVADERCYNKFTSFALLFSDLICCSSDVQMLKDKGIIVNHLGTSNRELVEFFHSMIKGVDRDIIDPEYSNKFHALNTYSAPSYIKKIVILLFHFFTKFSDWFYSLHKFFRRGYNFVAAMITLLTVVQTCYSVVAYHFPKN